MTELKQHWPGEPLELIERNERIFRLYEAGYDIKSIQKQLNITDGIIDHTIRKYKAFVLHCYKSRYTNKGLNAKQRELIAQYVEKGQLTPEEMSAKLNTTYGPVHTYICALIGNKSNPLNTKYTDRWDLWAWKRRIIKMEQEKNLYESLLAQGKSLYDISQEHHIPQHKLHRILHLLPTIKENYKKRAQCGKVDITDVVQKLKCGESIKEQAALWGIRDKTLSALVNEYKNSYMA